MEFSFGHLSDALNEGPVALATVVAAKGSTPRLAGARCFLTADGRSHGTVGGGLVESRTTELARLTLADGQPRSFEADLGGRPGDIRDGICGGWMTVWIVRLTRDNALPPLLSAAESLKTGRRFTLRTALDALAPVSADSPSSIPEKQHCRLGDESFVEHIDPPQRLLIIGAGHIGRSMALVAGSLDFAVTVQDDRREWLDPAEFPADCHLEADLQAAARELADWEGRRFAVLATRGFMQDLAALPVLGAIQNLEYLGVLGSRKRIATLLNTQVPLCTELRERGVLHAPVGVEIGAETPAEIAVSIAAELVKVRRKHSAALRAET